MLFSFFFDEATKLASSDYYRRNRNRILAKQRAYRQQNKAAIARRQRIYRRRVNSGMQRVRQRQSVGNSYVYTGYR